VCNSSFFEYCAFFIGDLWDWSVSVKFNLLCIWVLLIRYLRCLCAFVCVHLIYLRIEFHLGFVVLCFVHLFGVVYRVVHFFIVDFQCCC
jgi:hypothetical protein